MSLPEKLTKNQALVLGRLEAAETPLSAYAILDDLREEGFKAPLQVYRALDKLIATGQVHRIESLNAFVVCRHSGCRLKDTTVFAICDRCGAAEELGDHGLSDRLQTLAADRRFDVRQAVVELRGICDACG